MFITAEEREKYYTVQEAVEHLKLKASRAYGATLLREEIHAGRLAASRIPGKGKRARFLIKKEDLSEFQKKYLTPQPAAIHLNSGPGIDVFLDNEETIQVDCADGEVLILQAVEDEKGTYLEMTIYEDRHAFPDKPTCVIKLSSEVAIQTIKALNLPKFIKAFH